MRIQIGLDTSRIRIKARLGYVWKRFPRGTPSAAPPLRFLSNFISNFQDRLGVGQIVIYE